MNRRTFLKATGGSLGAFAGAREWTVGASQRSAQSSVRDVVVVGAGAFGGWTALYLQEMGATVTLIDQYGAGNSRASSGGETRQIRAGYGDREMYTRWVIQAFDRRCVVAGRHRSSGSWRNRDRRRAARSNRNGRRRPSRLTTDADSLRGSPSSPR